jgi:hypothetical protein
MGCVEVSAGEYARRLEEALVVEAAWGVFEGAPTAGGGG